MRFRLLIVLAAGAMLCLSPAPAGAAPGAPSPAAPVVTILGDSITAGLGLPAADALPAQLQAALMRNGVLARVRGAGVSGDTTAGGLARVDFSVAPDTRLCVVALGANDYLQSVPPAQMQANLTAIVQRLKARHIRVLLLGGLAPAHSSGAYGKAFGAAFVKVARAQDVPLAADFLGEVVSDPRLKQGDGLHPNAEGVRHIVARLAPAVARAL